MIGLQARFDPVIAHLRELVRQGYLGRVLATNLVGSGQAWGAITDPAHVYAFDRRNGVTPLSVSVGHALDALTFVLGDVDSVTATLGIGHREINVAEQRTYPVHHARSGGGDRGPEQWGGGLRLLPWRAVSRG